LQEATKPIAQHWGQGPFHNWGRGPFGGKNGRNLTKGLQGVSKWVGDHPWEVVIGVAVIASGGYLIFAQGYVLSLTVEGVQVVTITAGTTSGVVVGGSLITGSAVAAAYMSATGNSYTPGGGTEGSDQTLEYHAQAPKGNNPQGSAQPIKNGPPHKSPTPQAPKSQAVSNAPPALPTNATVSQRFAYALNASQWVDANHPLSSATFDKDKLSPPEEQLVKAIIALGEIKDNDDDIAVRKQAEEMDDWSTLPKEELIHKMGEELLKVTFGHFAADIYSWANDITSVIAPVQLTEGDALLRDNLINQLFDKLNSYEQKRKGLEGPSWAQPVSPD
jgi:hypothetical protein